MSEDPKVFISYARKDGETFATVLRKRLESEHPEITLWQDRARMEGGVGWWKQISEALEKVEFLVLIMTPAAMRSPIAQKEWRYARQQGVCVYPVKGVPDSELDYATLPRWMSKAHFFDLAHEWETFVNHLKSPCQAVRVPFMAPDLPEDFVQRSALFEQLLSQLLEADRKNPVAITTALHGAGGLGKTTLAAALCHHDDIITAFDDGILWVTLGQKPNVQAGLATLYAALVGEHPAFSSEEDAAFHLAQKLEDKNCLIVIDDAWDAAHLKSFMRGGTNCTRLITTRNFDIAAESKRVNVDEMTSSEAVQMLTARLATKPQSLRPFQDLAQRLGEWPLLLKLASATLRHRIARGDTLNGALDYLNKAFDRRGVIAFDPENPTERHQAFARTLEVSLELLKPEERERYAELAVFPEDTDVPLAIVATLWEMDDFETERLIERADNFSLLDFNLRTGTIRLHDVKQAYLVTRLTDRSALHSMLVKAWGDPHHLSEPYAWRRLSYHLVEAERKEDLRRLLLDFDWLQTKLCATDVAALLSDFDFLPNDADVRLLQGAIRLSAHVLIVDKTQLAGQLLGRLSADVSSDVRKLQQQAAGWRGAPWLRPLAPLLTAPGGALLFTLAGHSGRVRGVAVTSDGKRAVSASDDHTLKVWNLRSGSEERTLMGHTDWVRAVAVTPNGQYAISASDDHTLKVWNIETGSEVQTMSMHSARPRALAVTPDGKLAILAPDDGSLRIWDLMRGTEELRLKGHAAKVNSFSVTPDGRRIISASDDRTLKVWNLEHRTEIYTLCLSG